MSQVSPMSSMSSIGASARPGRRDIGLGRRYAAERRFRFYGMAAFSSCSSSCSPWSPRATRPSSSR